MCSTARRSGLVHMYMCTCAARLVRSRRMESTRAVTAGLPSQAMTAGRAARSPPARSPPTVYSQLSACVGEPRFANRHRLSRNSYAAHVFRFRPVTNLRSLSGRWTMPSVLALLLSIARRRLAYTHTQNKHVYGHAHGGRPEAGAGRTARAELSAHRATGYPTERANKSPD